MGTGYTRNDTSNNISDGNIINAADLDGEFDAIVTAFSTTGHTHDGTSAEGGAVTVVGPTQDLVVSATQVLPKLTGALSIGSDALEFQDLYIDGVAYIDGLGRNILVATDKKVQFRDSAIFINSSVDGQLDIDADVEIELATATLDINATATDISGTLAVGGNTTLSGTLTASNGGSLTGTWSDLGTVTTIDINGGTITGITDIAVADGGTGASTASGARTNLGLVIGTNVQAWDADLDTLAGLAKTDSNFIVGNGTNWVVESGATARASLGLTIGTDVQAYDADLATIAGLAKTDSNFIVGNGTSWVVESGSTARTSLGLGSIATQASTSVNIDGGAIDGTTIGATSAAAGTFTSLTSSGAASVASLSSSGAVSGTSITGTSLNITGTTVTGVLDEDTMSSNSASKLATQQSIKAYVDTEIAGISTTIAQDSIGAYELNVTGNGTTSQFLRADGDGSFTWATPTDTNTTYSAGSGIALSGTTFSVAAGTGLTQDAGGLSHSDTSSQASVNNSGRTYIQDITLDDFGHVTAIASATETVTDTNTTYSAGTGLSLSGTTFNLTTTFNAVGTYGFFFHIDDSTVSTVGGTISGSDLCYASSTASNLYVMGLEWFEGSVTDVGAGVSSDAGTSPSGTWQNMGPSRSDSSSTFNSLNLFIRTA